MDMDQYYYHFHSVQYNTPGEEELFPQDVVDEAIIETFAPLLLEKMTAGARLVTPSSSSQLSRRNHPLCGLTAVARTHQKNRHFCASNANTLLSAYIGRDLGLFVSASVTNNALKAGVGTLQVPDVVCLLDSARVNFAEAVKKIIIAVYFGKIYERIEEGTREAWSVESPTKNNNGGSGTGTDSTKMSLAGRDHESRVAWSRLIRWLDESSANSLRAMQAVQAGDRTSRGFRSLYDVLHALHTREEDTIQGGVDTFNLYETYKLECWFKTPDEQLVIREKYAKLFQSYPILGTWIRIMRMLMIFAKLVPPDFIPVSDDHRRRSTRATYGSPSNTDYFSILQNHQQQNIYKNVEPID